MVQSDIFQSPSTFILPVQDPLISAFESCVMKEIHSLETKWKQCSFNLKREEVKLLDDLRNDTSITIKLADKRGLWLY